MVKKIIVLLFVLVFFVGISSVLVSVAQDEIDIHEKVIIRDVDADERTNENYVTCKALGMTPGNSVEGSANFNKLKNAIDSGKNILVDDSYYLDNISSEESIFLENLTMEGITPNAEFKFYRKSYLFRIKKDISANKIMIDRVAFTAEHDGHNNNAPNIFYSATTDTWFINEFTIANCTFAGGIRLFTEQSSPLVDPSVTPFGFKYVNIIDNYFINIGSGRETINMSDCTYDLIIIEGNYVTNMDDTFFYSAITNEHPYRDNVELRRNKLIFRNNSIINDDDCWITDHNWYACAALNEGFSVEYTGNHVEGLKTDFTDVALSDAYLSSVYVYSKSNISKNNIIASSTKPHTPIPLMFSKAYPAAWGIEGYRYYEGNTYIVEEKWLEKVLTERGILANKNNAICSLMEINRPMKEFVCRNNSINVYWINMGTFNSPVSKVLFEYNHIEAKYISGYAFIGYFNDSHNKSIKYNNNVITAKEKNTTGAFGGTLNNMLLGYLISENGDCTLDLFEMCNNRFELYNLPAYFKGIDGVSVNNFKFNDNVVNRKDGDTSVKTQSRFFTNDAPQFPIMNLSISNNP